MALIRSIAFNVIFYLSIFPITSVIIILYPFLSTIALQRFGAIWIKFSLFLLKFLCGVSWRVEGRQVTLYSYLKTRMGTRYVLHFDNDVFMSSLNIAKWNIYSVALQDLTFFTFSYLKVNFNYQNVNQAKEIFNKILDDEISNKMPPDIIEETKKTFNERLQNLNWENYHKDLPFNPSALSLYKWAPIAEELKSLDRKIVLNSMILKWDIIR